MESVHTPIEVIDSVDHLSDIRVEWKWRSGPYGGKRLDLIWAKYFGERRTHKMLIFKIFAKKTWSKLLVRVTQGSSTR